MATAISRTILGTSDPLDLCQGFAAFPKLGTLRAAVSSFGTGSTALLNASPQVLGSRLSVFAGYDFLFGICGPSYAIKFAAEGETTGDELDLAISEDEMAGGLVFGANLGVELGVSLETWSVHYEWANWRFVGRWDSALSLKFKLDFDLIEVGLAIIQKVLEEAGEEDPAQLEKIPLVEHLAQVGLIGAWGLFDERQDTFIPNGGKFSVSPGLTIPIDVCPFIPQLKAVKTSLRALWGDLGVGPTIEILFPLNALVTGASVDDQKYQGLSFSDGHMHGSGGQESANPKELGVELTHSVQFDFTFGVFFTLSLCKLFNLSAHVRLPGILGLLGIDVSIGGPYKNSLANGIGSDTIHSTTSPVEVLFDLGTCVR